jgi:toxin HigB-1
VLRSFRDRDTEAIWLRQRSRLLDGPTQRVAWRKLAILDAAETLADLRVPPGNRLEKLRGDREGQYSIRINQQWRICFSWSEAGAASGVRHPPVRRSEETFADTQSRQNSLPSMSCITMHESLPS